LNFQQWWCAKVPPNRHSITKGDEGGPL
jgi:hypothetical protein